jgi:tetratricopeptide (TPR) repeat protein
MPLQRRARLDRGGGGAPRRRGQRRALGWAQAEQKAQRSYLKDPDGDWAARSLYLVGRARVRRGDWEGAREALEGVLRSAPEPSLVSGATLYLGAVAAATGDQEQAIPLLNQALATVGPGRLRAEGHLWRARLFLSMGLVDQGWWDLERAGEADPGLRVPAALERLTWAVVHGDSARAREGARALLLDGEGAGRADTLTALLRLEEARTGARGAALLLESAEQTAWGAVQRDRALLARATLYVRAGDTARALADATEIAEQPGSRGGAVDARLFLARLALGAADSVEVVDDARTLLFPVVGDPAVQRLFEATGQFVLLSERGRQGQPLAVFAAAEIARDALAAPRLASALFLAYADATPAPPWRGKALLAALDAAPDEALREDIRRRASALAEDPTSRSCWAAPPARSRTRTSSVSCAISWAACSRP